MTKLRTSFSILCGKTKIPPSKSHTLRAILFGALGVGKSTIYNYLASPDTTAMIQACTSLGASITDHKDYLEIQGISGNIVTVDNIIDANNSGIILRFLTAIAALGSKHIVITGDQSIRENRPMKPLINALMQLGANVVSTKEDDFAPLIIKGPIKPGKVQITGEDSQFVSALLIALALADGPSELEVKKPGELPWVGVTLGWFDRLGIFYKNIDYKTYHLQGKTKYPGFTYTVPTDFSSASFVLAAALITKSEITIENIDMTDSQGDKNLIYLLQKMHAHIKIDNTQLHVNKTESLQGLKIDINNMIDAIPILAVIACFANSPTHIYNGKIARTKECDRISCITKELRKMGAKIDELEDGLIIYPSKLIGCDVRSHNDHRMAMALAVAGFACDGMSTIDNTTCIEKTFPNFAETLKSLNANIEVL